MRSSSSRAFIKRYLIHHSSSTTIDANIFNAFLFEYLKADGVFLLRIVKKNTNDIVVGELVSALWDNFKQYSRFAKEEYNYQQTDELLPKENVPEDIVFTPRVSFI